MGVSLKPSDQSDFQGLEGIHKVSSAVFQEFDYTDKGGGSTFTGVGLMLKCLNLEGEDREQFYSVGSPDAWAPSDDGKSIDSVSGAGSIRKSSNFGIFMQELDNAGFGEDELADDISAIEELICDFVPKAVKRNIGGQDQESTIPVVGQILDEKDHASAFAKKGRASGAQGSRRSGRGTRGTRGGDGSKKKKASRRSSRADSGSDGFDAQALAAVKDLLEDYEEIPRDELADLVLKQISTNPDLKEIVKHIYDGDFLSEHPEDWTYEDDTVYALEE